MACRRVQSGVCLHGVKRDYKRKVMVEEEDYIIRSMVYCNGSSWQLCTNIYFSWKIDHCSYGRDV